MDESATPGSSPAQFVPGMAVFDSDDQKIGMVSEHNSAGRYLTVQKGWLFPHDYYVPVGLVSRSDADGVYLRLHRDEMTAEEFSYPPTDDEEPADVAPGHDREARLETVTAEVQDLRVPVHEEELSVTTEESERGRVHLHKDVVTTPRSFSVPVTREEIHVERVALADDSRQPGPDVFTEKDIEIPVMGEELVVGKRTVITEEIRLHKETVTEQRTIDETVRRERVTVEGADHVVGTDREGETPTQTPSRSAIESL